MAVVRFELFAAGAAAPDATWATVANPRRLPDWTDVERVERVDPEPIVVGSTVVTTVGGRRVTWRVRTLAQMLLEVETELDRGRLGLGARVVGDPLGSRVILACAFAPASRAAAARFRLVDGPALRRRFDRWAPEAMRAAASAR